MNTVINIVLLTGDGLWGKNIVAYFEQRGMPISCVICEERVPRKSIFRRRIKKLGFWTACGQVLFQILAIPLLNRIYRPRIERIKAEHQITDAPIPKQLIHHVQSVNDATVVTLLQKFKPDVVLVAGTRIIKPNLLACSMAPFINIHAGITPLYRGVHGAYWALVERNPAACGVTVHLVDEGIDTGAVLGQTLITPTAHDSFVTYTLLQLKEGLQLLYNAVQAAGEHRLTPQASLVQQSKLRSHPTLWFYLWQWLRHGVK